MKNSITVTITSLLAIAFASFHFADDVVRGFEPGKVSTIFGVFLLAGWLYGTLALAGRRSGCIIVLIYSILASVIPVLHMRGAGMAGGRIAGTSGMFFWDPLRSRRDGGLLRCPRGAGTLEPAASGALMRTSATDHPDRSIRAFSARSSSGSSRWMTPWRFQTTCPVSSIRRVAGSIVRPKTLQPRPSGSCRFV